jgi:hypothetical protein
VDEKQEDGARHHEIDSNAAHADAAYIQNMSRHFSHVDDVRERDRVCMKLLACVKDIAACR